jgi:hypothetical protein
MKVDLPVLRSRETSTMMGSFCCGWSVKLLQVVVAQLFLLPEDVLHELVDVGKLARLRLELHRMIEVPELPVHHLLRD